MEKNLKNIQTFEQYTDKNLNISDVIDSISFNEQDSIITFEITKDGDIDIVTDSDYFNFLTKNDGQKLFNMLKKYYL